MREILFRGKRTDNGEAAKFQALLSQKDGALIVCLVDICGYLVIVQ